MALVLKDRIKQQTTTTGTTDAYALSGSLTGFETFAEIGDGNTTYYCCTDGTDFEIGIGTFTASGATLARTTILQSSNSDAAVDWQTGTRTIFVTQPAQKAVFLDASNIATFSDVDIDGGSIDGVTIGTNSAVTDLRVDRLKLNFNTISNTVTNDSITLNPNGTGFVNMVTDKLRIGDLGADVTLTTTGTGDLTLSTNEGTDTGTIVIADGVNGNISLTPNGTGEVDISKVDIDGGAIDGVTLGTNSAITEAQIDDININDGTIESSNSFSGLILKVNGQLIARVQSPNQTLTGGGLYLYQNNPYITFEGNTADVYETNLKVTDPTANRDITLPDATGTVAVEETGGLTLNNGVIALKNGGAQSEVRLYCESSNAHYAALKAPVHSDLQTSGNTTLTLPAVTTGTLVSTGDSGSVSTAMIADNAVTGDKLNDIANVSGSYTNADITVDAQGRITAAATGSGGGGGGSASDSFKTIAVTGTAGQSDVVASSSTDTLTFVAGSNMTITTDASTDTITFASSGGGGGGGGISTGKAIAMAMIFG